MTADDVSSVAGADERWFDSHCHLQDTYRPGGVEALQAVAQAAEAGVVGLVCVGTDAETSRQQGGHAAVAAMRYYGHIFEPKSVLADQSADAILHGFDGPRRERLPS